MDTLNDSGTQPGRSPLAGQGSGTVLAKLSELSVRGGGN